MQQFSLCNLKGKFHRIRTNMKRRSFLRNSALAGFGSLFIPNLVKGETIEEFKNKTAKNIIYLVSDGMSSGTLAMSDLYCKRLLGRPSHWINLYEQDFASKALMDMQSLSSVVTDSAAASSSWGGGHRILNGRLNVGPNGEEYTPILQKFKKAGKKVGCVTTVPVTHATPAGFSVISKVRGEQTEIAEQYLKLRFDVMMGGGDKYFNPKIRKDKKNMYAAFTRNNFTVVRNKAEMEKAPKNRPILGVFDDEALPYSVDFKTDKELQNRPTLAQMLEKAIDHLKGDKNGFVLQVEAGKVDWAAHGNDIAALLFDQLAFDDAVGVAMEFARKDGNTLVVVTTDHGNANPGLIYGKNCNKNFENIQNFKHSNEWILQTIRPDSSINYIKDLVYENSGELRLTDELARRIQSYYVNSKQEDGVYNFRQLPYKLLSEIQKNHTSVGWISMDHSSDYVELAMYGPGSDKLPRFMRNDQMHNFLLEIAGVNMLV